VDIVSESDNVLLLTIDPESSDFGLYEALTINIDDGFGGIATTIFDLEVVSNYAPIILTSVEPVVLSVGQTSSVSIVAEDPNGDNLLWDYGSLPSFITPTIDGDILTLELSPGVDDDNAVVPLYAESQIIITVIPYDPNHSIYVNFGSDEEVGFPWNSFTVFPHEGTVLNNLVNDQGYVTSNSLTLETKWGGSSTSGGLSSTLFEEDISTSYYWTSGVPEYMRLSGLEPTSIYSFTFFASRNKSDDRTTNFQIGSELVTLQRYTDQLLITRISSTWAQCQKM